MIGNLRAVPDAEIAMLLQHPERIGAVLHGDDEQPIPPGVREVRERGVVASILRLFAPARRFVFEGERLNESGGIEAESHQPARLTAGGWDPPEVAEEDVLDIDKAWHGIHFLLTGSAWEGEFPLAFLVSAGKEIGDEDVGYGPARGFMSREVREIASALEAISPDELHSRFDPAAMLAANIYPEIWDRDPADDDTAGYLVEYYGLLRDFIRRAADRRLGLLVWLN
jgi:hypothetical protein